MSASSKLQGFFGSDRVVSVIACIVTIIVWLYTSPEVMTRILESLYCIYNRDCFRNMVAPATGTYLTRRICNLHFGDGRRHNLGMDILHGFCLDLINHAVIESSRGLSKNMSREYYRCHRHVQKRAAHYILQERSYHERAS